MASPVPCYHCGLPVPLGTHFHAQILGEEQSLCCPGCQAVAETIVASGLESYYQFRTEPSANPEALPRELQNELSIYDRQDVQAPFITHNDNLADICLMVEGVSCAACGWLIERHLKNLPAVVKTSFNLSNHRLQVTWDDRQLPLSELLFSLRHIGYAAHPYQPDQAQQQLARENRRSLRQIGVAGLLWIQVMMATMSTWPEFNLDLSAEMNTILRWVSFFMTTPIIFYCCIDFFRGALRDLRTRHLTMDVSVSLAILGAYLAGIWSTITGHGEIYFDAVGMFALFLLSGRYLERRARERTAATTAQLVNLLPASCLRLDDKGKSQRILLTELQTGDRILVQPGSQVPADGLIMEGQSSLDESLLTGEYLPQLRQAGDKVTAGTLNVEGPLVVQVQALGTETQLSAIVRLLDRAQSEKPRLAELADRVAQYFLIIVLLFAFVVGIAWWIIDSSRAFWIVLALLVATCPCALSLATPTALTTATGTLHKLGLLITRGHVLSTLVKIDTVIFDKTGTLTEGHLTLKDIQPLGRLDADTCLSLAAALENHSEHPIARAFGHTSVYATQVQTQPGKGLQGIIEGQTLRIGQPQFVAALGKWTAPNIPGNLGQWLLLGNDHGPLAWFVLGDRIRDDAPVLLDTCRANGWATYLLSGDSSPMTAVVAEQLGITHARGGLTPDDKLAVLRDLHAQERRVLMLGDGVNDVPVLAGADISVAMGSSTDLAKTSADAILLSNRMSTLIQAFTLARRTHRIIIENLGWACLYNGLILPFAAVGWVTPLWAALGMSFSSLLVVLNALRLSALPKTRTLDTPPVSPLPTTVLE